TVRGAEAVVRLPLLLVGEDVVRRLHLLEALLGGRVARIGVGVVLARELAVGLLDLVGRRSLLHAEDVVERLSHRSPAAAPRRRRARDGRLARRACSPSARRRGRPPPPRRTAARAAPRGRA